MDDYEQMEIDVRLDSEISLQDNVAKIIQFTLEKQKKEEEESGRQPRVVKNKHEGYGIAAEAYSKVLSSEKAIKNGMNEYLALLSVDGETALNSCSRLYDAALNLSMNAIGMAADMYRILSDLYYGVSDKTPLEEYEASLEDGESADGFEEADQEAAEPDEEEPERSEDYEY